MRNKLKSLTAFYTQMRGLLSKRVAFRSARLRAVIVFSFAQFVPALLSSQMTQLGFSNSAPSFGHGHDYIQLLNETVNPADGSLTLKIGVPTPSGRGLNFPYAITYNSSIAHSFSQGTGPNRVPIFMTPAWAPNNSNATYPNGGWSDSLPKLVVEHIPYQEDDSMPPENDQQDTLIICESWQGFQFTDLTGQTHQPNLSVGYLYDQATGCNTPAPGTHNTGFDATVQGHADVGGAAEFATNDGTYYEFPLDSEWQAGRVVIYPQLIEDKNGNKLNIVNGPNNSNGFIAGGASISSGVTLSVVDTLGRNVVNLQPADATHEQLSVSGVPNPYILNYSSTPALTGIHTPQSSLILAGGPSLQTGSTMDTIDAFPQGSGTTALTSLALPDGGAYSFSYDTVFGNVNKITYPNGGYVSYTWGFPGGFSDDANYSGQYVVCIGGCTSSFYTTFRVYVQYAMPVILHREVSFDGSTIALTQDFSYQTTFRQGDMMDGWIAKTTTVTTNDLVAGTTSSVTYSYSPFTPYSQDPGQRYMGHQAQEYQAVYKDGSGNVLQTVCKVWSGGLDLLGTQKTILANGMVSEHDFDYTATGVSGAPTGGDDYGFSAPQSNPSCLSPYSPNFPSGNPAPGPLLASTRQTSNITATSPVSLYPYAPSIVDTPSSTITRDGSGNIVAETDYQYTDAIAQTVGGVSQHDPAYDSGSRVRQNLLSTTKQCFPSCPSVITVYSYDNTGQVISATDGRGNTTNYYYTDAYTANAGQPSSVTDAYPTTIMEPTTNGIQHIQHANYGYNDGKVRSITNENSNVTTYCYWTSGCSGSAYDPWMRLTQIQYPDGGSKSATYNDAGSSPTVVSGTVLNPSSTLIQTTIGDGMGHVIHTQTNSDPEGTVTVDAVYGGTGAVLSSSNPYRLPSDSTYGVSTNTYDALGRKILQQNPDGSFRQWCFNGMASSSAQAVCTANRSSVPNATWVDTADESGKRSQQVSDGMGRLVAVMEPDPATNMPSLETDYIYSALGNLMSVAQKGNSANGDLQHVRSFTYDSVSRLITSTNPETGTICYGIWNGSSCSGGYDANGNLLAKTDARGFTTNYSYDNLNRLIQTTVPLVNSSGVVTGQYQSTCFQYDSLSGAPTAANLVGHLTAEWTQSGNTCASSYTPSVALTAKVILGYDTLGRPLMSQQCIKGMCQSSPFTQNQTYDLAGNMTSWTDGRGLMTFSQQFDSAGRPVSVTNSLSGNGFPSVLFSAQGYTPASALQNWNVGNYLNFFRGYDSRLRVTSETVSH